MSEISRTLVKSAPELWAEISDAEALGRRLDAFGSVTILIAHPEELVAWEGELGSGTIRLEPSGFGTKVTLTAKVATTEPPPSPFPPDPPKLGLWARLLRRTPPMAPAPEPEAPQPRVSEAAVHDALTAMLDALGTAHHRPFSRA